MQGCHYLQPTGERTEAVRISRGQGAKRGGSRDSAMPAAWPENPFSFHRRAPCCLLSRGMTRLSSGPGVRKGVGGCRVGRTWPEFTRSHEAPPAGSGIAVLTSSVGLESLVTSSVGCRVSPRRGRSPPWDGTESKQAKLRNRSKHAKNKARGSTLCSLGSVYVSERERERELGGDPAERKRGLTPS